MFKNRYCSRAVEYNIVITLVLVVVWQAVKSRGCLVKAKY